MPNWVKNRLTITGDNAEEIIKNHVVTDEEGKQKLDFNSIDKLPEELLIERGARSADGFSLYIAKINPLISNIGTKEDKIPFPKISDLLVKKYPDAIRHIPELLLRPAEVEVLRRQYKGEFEEVVELGKKCMDNLKKYGVMDWHDWSREHWGSKWDSCQTAVDGNVITFLTANSPAIPLIRTLSQRYPDHEFKLQFAEQEASITTGQAIFVRGDILEGNQYEPRSPEAYEMFFQLWGGKEDYVFDEYEGTYDKKPDTEME